MTALPTEALPLAPAEPAPARPALRLVPVPASAPPYDDEPGRPPRLRLVAAPAPAPEPVPADDDAWLAAARTPSAQLPAAGAFARVLLQGLLEVAAGVRPVRQLRHDTTPELYLVLAEALARGPRATGARPDRRAVRSLHVQQRAEGVAEVCATVQRGPRTVALALRLEGQDGRWRCTDVAGL
jgi:hypothetical protein